MREEIERARRDGFTPEEVAAAKSGWLQGRQVSRSQDAELTGLLQRELFTDRTLAWDAALEKKVSALTPEAVVRLAEAAHARYFANAKPGAK